jgi:hypothetical protein
MASSKMAVLAVICGSATLELAGAFSPSMLTTVRAMAHFHKHHRIASERVHTGPDLLGLLQCAYNSMEMGI